jgi:hypothetical protein
LTMTHPAQPARCDDHQDSSSAGGSGKISRPAKRPWTKPNWPAVKRAYLKREGSLPALSRRFGVPLSTLQKRCCHEGWTRQIEALCNVAASSATRVAIVEGEKLGRTAAQFVKDTIARSETWLAKLDGKAIEDLAPDEIRACVSSLKELVAIERQAHGLDSDRVSSVVNVAIMGDCELVPSPTSAPLGPENTTEACWTGGGNSAVPIQNCGLARPGG